MTAISSLMTHDRLVTIGPDALVAEAARTIADAGISHLLVTGDGEHLLGVLCVCDLDRAPSRTPLREHLRSQPVTVEASTDVAAVAELMLSSNVSCLPVVEGGALKGVVTLHDLRRLGLLEGETERCSACGSTEHVHCAHGVGFCIDCTRKSQPPGPDGEDELGGGD
jgi:predicted transcriptional regulator